MKLSSLSVTRGGFWCVAITFGFLQAWSSRMNLVNDTISYLDVGDYILAGRWSMAVNGVWNPLYAFLLGVTLHTFRPSAYWEYPTVHLLLFVVFLFAAACFDFFLRELIPFHRERRQEALDLPDWPYQTIAYVLFLWSSLALIGVSETNPDMLVAAFFYLACGLLLRIRRGTARRRTYAWMGLALGLGYLTKSVMFPVSLVCLAVALLIDIMSRRRVSGTIIGALVFLAFSAPFITALSIARGKLTFGESGTYNFLVHVNHRPESHWQGEDSDGERLVHPTQQIFDRPATFKFEGKPGGSYPVWFDPSYWYEGARPRVSPREMAAVLSKSLAQLAFKILIALNGSLFACLFLVFWVSGRGRLILKDIGEFWFLLAPSVAALGLYAAVHIEMRYLAPFLVVAVLSLWFSVCLASTPGSSRLQSGSAVLLVLMLLSPIGPDAIPKNSSSFVELLKPLGAEANRNEQVASGLRAMGLRRGDRIASLEYSNCAVRLNSCEGAATWARLGGFRIVAEVFYWPENPATRLNNFWDTDEATQKRLIQALSQSGASVVVSRQTPRGVDSNSWRQIGRTPYYVHWLIARPNAVSLLTPGPLAVCTTNPRYFCDPKGNVVFLAGDHTWADLQDLGENGSTSTGAFDFNGYMTFLSSYGFTWLRLWSFMYSQQPPCGDCPSKVTYVGPVWPWVRAGPGNADDGLLKTDFTQMDPKYFNRLRSRIITAGQNGLYVSVMLFSDVGGSESSTDGDPFVSGNNVNGVSCSAPCPVTLPLNSTVWSYEQAYIHKVVDTVHDLPNVMYEVDNEPPLASASWVTQVVNEIRNYESAAYGSQHPVGINYGAGVPDSNVYNTNADFVSPSTKVPPAATGQCPVATGNGGAVNTSSGRCKVVINDSDHSYYYTLMQSDGATGQIAWAWENFTLGNGLAFMDPYTFPWPGRNNCTRAPADGDSGLCAPNGLDLQWNPITQTIGDIVTYARKIDLKHMTPQPALFGSRHGLASISAPVNYLMFCPNRSTAETITTVAGTYTVEVFDTAAHAVVSVTPNVSIGTSYTFRPPSPDNYVVWIH